MARIMMLGFILFTLTGCALMQSNPVAVPTPIPTFAPNALVTPAANLTPAVALGGKQSGDLFVWIYSQPNPPIRGENTFEAFVTDATGKAIKDAKLSFDVDMTNMSHGKNVVTAASNGEGRYNGKLSFMMPGPWRVLVNIERAGQTSIIRFDFNVNSK